MRDELTGARTSNGGKDGPSPYELPREAALTVQRHGLEPALTHLLPSREELRLAAGLLGLGTSDHDVIAPLPGRVFILAYISMILPAKMVSTNNYN